MALDVVFLVDGSSYGAEVAKAHKKKYPFAKFVDSDFFDVDAVKAASAKSMTSCFYVVKNGTYVDDFDFSFKPEDHQKEYVHAWPYKKNEGKESFSVDPDEPYGVFLFSKKIVREASTVIPTRLGSGIVKYKESCGRRQNLDIIVVSYGEPEMDANQKKFEEQLGISLARVDHPNKKEAHWLAANASNTEQFFVVDISSVPVGFDFNFFPHDYDSEYVHIWKNSETTYGGVRLYSKEHFRGELGDDQVDAFGFDVKWVDVLASTKEEHLFDIVFISYDEPNAEANWKALSSRFPRARRVHKVEGLVNAHAKAAEVSKTQSFFVVDGDTEILDTFDFNVDVPDYDRKYVHVWKCRNPVNGLEYGYGGVKLLHKSMFENFEDKIVDMTTILGFGVKVVDECVSITHFDSDSFRAFRGTFRECVKLSSGAIKNQNCSETAERLNTWLTVANGQFAEVVSFAAKLGKDYGTMYANEPEILSTINNYEWLHNYYKASYLKFKENELIGTKYNKLDMQTIINLTNLLYDPNIHLELNEIRDALSSGQIASKLWLIDELNKLDFKDIKLDMLIVGGWIGLLSNFIFQFYKNPDAIQRILSTDLDPRCELIADRLNLQNNIDGWKFKAATADMMRLDYNTTIVNAGDPPVDFESRWNVIINTSGEHIDNLTAWSDLIPEGKLMIVQSNNYFNCDGHISCVNSEVELAEKLNLSKILFQGTLPCAVYDRFMVIGIK